MKKSLVYNLITKLVGEIKMKESSAYKSKTKIIGGIVMNRFLMLTFVMLLMCMLLMSSDVCAAVIQIDSIEELQLIGNDIAYPLNGEYELTQDIDASDTINWNAGAGFKPIGTETNPFIGKFNGNGHKITGLYINRSNEGYVGLFGNIDSGAEVNRLGIEDCWIVGNWLIGSLVGNSRESSITSTYSTGTVSGSDYVGGLVGSNAGSIMSSYSMVEVSGNYYVGGLVGWNNGSITSSYSTGTVSGSDYVGGLVGDNEGGSITSSYSNGAVSGAYAVGGLVGYNYGGSITSSYWDIETSGQSSSAGGTGKTTEEMKQQATYVGWDFTTVWTIIEEQTYPYFLWQSSNTEGEGSTDGEGVSEGSVEGTPEGEGTEEGISEGEGIAEGTTEGEMPPHSADPNGDGVIELTELLRVIQLFNMGGYHCDPSNPEDGYAGGSDGDHSCIPHASDYDEQDWVIDLGELLRLIQFFNMGGYYPCPGVGEDGYCPGTD